MRPRAKFTIQGDIEDFTRLDNMYRSFKREGERLLSNATLTVDVQFEEKVGSGEVP